MRTPAPPYIWPQVFPCCGHHRSLCLCNVAHVRVTYKDSRFGYIFLSLCGSHKDPKGRSCGCYCQRSRIYPMRMLALTLNWMGVSAPICDRFHHCKHANTLTLGVGRPRLLVLRVKLVIKTSRSDQLSMPR